MSSVSVIIPTWNRDDLLRSILENLRSQTRPPDQVIVVDNGSTDSTLQVATEFHAEMISLPDNRGFAEAVNAGIAHASGDWFLILNNDVILQPDWLERLLATARREGAAFAAGKLLQTAHGQIDGTWDLLSRGAHAWRCGYGRPDGGAWSTRRKISFAPMTAALFQRRLFHAVGMLDARFEAYYEDVDFGFRCALAGFEGVYEPAAVATHLSRETLGKGSSRVLFLTARNQIFLLAKHYPAQTLLRFAWPILVARHSHCWALRNRVNSGLLWPEHSRVSGDGALSALKLLQLLLKKLCQEANAKSMICSRSSGLILIGGYTSVWSDLDEASRSRRHSPSCGRHHRHVQ